MELLGWWLALLFLFLALGIAAVWWCAEQNDRLEKRIMDAINGQVIPLIRQKADAAPSPHQGNE